jgi:alkylated DNA repair dioxygenase AlkB/predicted NAD-dependent protein-ADP-ribosyltransferase YbiA (DUF1768 family)
MAAARPYIYFLSTGAAKYRPLSNFFAVPVAVDLAKMPTFASLVSPLIDRQRLPPVLSFPSSEHAWQALKANDLSTFQLFLTGGKWAYLTTEAVGALVRKKTWSEQDVLAEAQKKVTFYSRAGLVMVGVVAKYAASEDRAKRLGYALRPGCEFLAAETEAAVWHELLMAKMLQNEAPRRVLLRTGDKMIVEFVKSARRMHSHWGGLVEENGTVTGANKMGVFLERARSALLQQGHVAEEEEEEVAVVKKAKRAREEEEERPAKRARVPKTTVITATGTASMNLIDDGLSRVPYVPAFFSRNDADRFFRALMAETPWTTETIKRWNKEIVTPRRVYAFSDANVVYRYIQLSRTGAAWTPTMLEIKAQVEAYCGVKFNFCFVNLYRNGQDCIGAHSDDEKALIPGHMIASVSFSPNGGDRDLVFEHKTSKERLSVRLAHGSLYVMQGETQKHYKHMIPRRANVTAPRINLTWRQIAVPQ